MSFSRPRLVSNYPTASAGTSVCLQQTSSSSVARYQLFRDRSPAWPDLRLPFPVLSVVVFAPQVSLLHAGWSNSNLTSLRPTKKDLSRTYLSCLVYTSERAVVKDL